MQIDVGQRGKITAPCGVPISASDHSASSITPAFSPFWISRRIRRSATRCCTNLTSVVGNQIEKSPDVGVKNVVHTLLVTAYERASSA